MTTTDARGWIAALIKAMHEETSGSWPDPEYKDEVYSALEMAIKALENHDTFMKYAYSQGKQDALSQEPTDIVSRGVFEQVRWERDIAIEQLNELGYELGQKIEPCDDAVSSKKAVLEAIFQKPAIHGSDGSWYHADDIRKAVEELSFVTQKSGKWITKIKSDLRGDMWPTNPKCSECGGEPYYSNTIYNYKFCPYCGAEMEGEGKRG